MNTENLVREKKILMLIGLNTEQRKTGFVPVKKKKEIPEFSLIKYSSQFGPNPQISENSSDFLKRCSCNPHNFVQLAEPKICHHFFKIFF